MKLDTVFRFERLAIWQKSVQFADIVYRVSSGFPTREQYGLTSQLRRAAVSISANIAEGSSRKHNKDFSRYIEISFGSLCETISHLRIAEMQSLLTKDQYIELYGLAAELSKMLSAFRNTLGDWNTGQSE
ncbi:MAG: four helix bundle protein [Armatimonadetes bacterium]|nr:four helix bundle protein [Armatimonadota bacterium]